MCDGVDSGQHTGADLPTHPIFILCNVHVYVGPYLVPTCRLAPRRRVITGPLLKDSVELKQTNWCRHAHISGDLPTCRPPYYIVLGLCICVMASTPANILEPTCRPTLIQYFVMYMLVHISADLPTCRLHLLGKMAIEVLWLICLFKCRPADLTARSYYSYEHYARYIYIPMRSSKYLASCRAAELRCVICLQCCILLASVDL